MTAPMVTVPKSTVTLGVTDRSLRATALATGEHGLSLPLEVTAVTAAKYLPPLVSPVSVAVAV